MIFTDNHLPEKPVEEEEDNSVIDEILDSMPDLFGSDDKTQFQEILAEKQKEKFCHYLSKIGNYTESATGISI